MNQKLKTKFDKVFEITVFCFIFLIGIIGLLITVGFLTIIQYIVAILSLILLYVLFEQSNLGRRN